MVADSGSDALVSVVSSISFLAECLVLRALRGSYFLRFSSSCAFRFYASVSSFSSSGSFLANGLFPEL
jgi:hypothetical protein